MAWSGSFIGQPQNILHLEYGFTFYTFLLMERPAFAGGVQRSHVLFPLDAFGLYQTTVGLTAC